jgi:hypothetical protein
MGRQIFGEATRGISRGPGVNAGGERTLGEVPTQTEIAVATGAARGVDPAWSTRKPRVQHDPLADLQPRDPGTQLRHLGDYFVAQNGGSGEITVESAIGEVFTEIHEDLLGV